MPYRSANDKCSHAGGVAVAELQSASRAAAAGNLKFEGWVSAIYINMHSSREGCVRACVCVRCVHASGGHTEPSHNSVEEILECG